MGSAAPVAADFGGTAAATSAPLAAGASAAVPDLSAGFAGTTAFPAGGDILTQATPSILPGGDALAAGGMAATPATWDPFAPLDAGSWASYGAPPAAMTPAAYGEAPAAAPPPTATSPYTAMAQGEGIGANVVQDPSIQNYATATQASPSPYSGPSATDTLTSTLNSPWTKLALAGAPLAVGLSGITQKLPASAQAAEANARALASQGGNLNPAQQAALAQSRQNLTNQWKQTLFNQGVMAGKGGVPMSTQWPQIAALIDQQVKAQAQQMIQDNIKNALAGDQQLIALAQLQMQQDKNFQNTLMSATTALGRVAGLGGDKQTFTITPTGT